MKSRFHDLIEQREKIKKDILERLISCGVTNINVIEVKYRKVDEGVDPVLFRAYYDGPITLDVLNKVSMTFATREIKIDCELGTDDDSYHDHVLEVS